MGNPFLDHFPDLLTLDSRNCANVTWRLGRHRQKTVPGVRFVTNVTEKRSQSIHTAIKRNSLAIFQNTKPKVKSKECKKIKALQNNVHGSLFGQLYIYLCRIERVIYRIFLNTNDLLECLEQPDLSDPPTNYNCRVTDGATVVHCLPTASVCTYSDYAENVFIPYLDQQLHNCDRIDVVWDSYVPDSQQRE